MTGIAPEPPALRTARLRLIGSGILIALALALALGLPRELPLQDAFFDAMQRRSPRIAEATPVVIVEIDEKSIAALGPWPWPRTLLAQLVHVMNAYGPAAIGVDIVMPEPDPFSPERVLAHANVGLALLEQIAELPSNDAELATAFRVSPVVAVLAGAPATAGQPSRPMRVAPMLVRDVADAGDDAARALSQLMKLPGVLSTLATLNDAASGWGLITVDDRQGVIRRVPLVASVNGTLAPAFALEMWRVAARSPAVRVNTAGGEVRGVTVGDRFFATEPDGGVRPYFSRRNADRAVSAIDVLQEKVAGDRLKRSFVLIGATALALGDSVFTPVGEKIPGVELHAQLLENMSDGTFLVRPAWASYAEGSVLLLLGGLLIAAMPRLSLRYALPIALACALVLPLVAHGLFRSHRLLFDAATPAIALVLLVGAMLALSLADATRNRKALQVVLQRQREESARVAGEMQAAQRIQLDTLPRPESLQDSRVELAAAMEPALEVGGDLYDFYRLDDRRLFFLLGDVSGKGLPASIFMAVSKALCKSTVLRAGITDVGVLVAEANAEVSRDNPAALFVTAFAAILDLETGEVGYCNAGQENPWLLKANGAIERLADGGGPPLCVVDGYGYHAASATLARGDLICVVSDGITEASDTRGALYGTARVEAALANAHSAREAVDAIRTSVRAFAGGAVQADDMTVLALRWLGAPSPAAPA